MAQIKNKDFFRTTQSSKQEESPKQAAPSPKPASSSKPAAQSPKQGESPKPAQRRVTDSAARRELLKKCSEAATALKELGMAPLGAKIESLMTKTRDERFTVAFVGEFSRGKTSLINSLIGADVLPASGLPTTAIITRVGYGREPQLITINPDGSRGDILPFGREAWKVLKIDNFKPSGDFREGTAAVRLPVGWLGKYGVILLDTPGAGDLEERRMKSVAHALLASDAAVITIDATQPLSLSEQSFIKQRVIATRMPFLAVAVTKMDMVPLSERDTQMDYILKLIRSKGWNFPVVIGGKGVEMPSDKYKKINGSSRLKELIIEWAGNPRRASLLDTWLSENVISVLDMAETAWLDQQRIAEARGEEHRRLQGERLDSLKDLRKVWEELRSEMTSRCETASEEYDSRMKQAAASMTERLQHEVDRFPEPKRWVEKEYNFRVRHELAALSQSLDAWASRTVGRDQAWLNRRLQEQFRTALNVETVSLGQLNEAAAETGGDELALEDLRKSQKTAGVATMVLGLGAAVALASVGGFIPLATMGVSGGAGLWSRSMFEKKTERQREEIKALIAREIPRILRDASEDSRRRLRQMYADILSEALKREQEWLAVQSDMIQATRDAKGEELSARVNKALSRIKALKETFPKT